MYAIICMCMNNFNQFIMNYFDSVDFDGWEWSFRTPSKSDTAAETWNNLPKTSAKSHSWLVITKYSIKRNSEIKI